MQYLLYHLAKSDFLLKAFWTDAMRIGDSYSFDAGNGDTVVDSDGKVIEAKESRPYVILDWKQEFQPKGCNRTFEAICKMTSGRCSEYFHGHPIHLCCNDSRFMAGGTFKN